MSQQRLKAKRFLALVLLLSMLLSVIASAASVSDFNDVSYGSWYYDAVDFAARNGLFEGTSGTTFSPHMNMNRGMFVTVLGRRANVDTSSYPGSSFSDVSSSIYYAPYAAWASELGVTTGTGDGRFSPDSNITRQDIVTMLYRYVKTTGGNSGIGSDSEFNGFPDSNSVSSYARDAMVWAINNGVIKGSNGRINPKNNATRAEVAQMFMNADELLDGNSTPAPSTVRLGRYTCYTDSYDFEYQEEYRPSVTLKGDKSFTMVLNYGEGMADAVGTWRSYEDDNDDIIVVLTVTTEPWDDSDTYVFYLSSNGDLIKEDGYMGITPSESVFKYDGDSQLNPDFGVQFREISNAYEDRISKLTAGGDEVSSTVIMDEMYSIAKDMESSGQVKNLVKEEEGIFYDYPDGTQGGLIFELPREDNAGLSSHNQSFTPSELQAPITSKYDEDSVHLMANNIIGNNKILIAGYSDRNSSASDAAGFINSYADIANQFRNHQYNFSVTVKTTSPTVADLKTFGEYGAVFLDFPNVVWRKNAANIIMNEPYSDSTYDGYREDRNAGRIALYSVISPKEPNYHKTADGVMLTSKSYKYESAYAIVSGSFFSYYGKNLPNSYIHLGFHNSVAATSSLSSILLKNGAGAVSGYDDLVEAGYNIKLVENMVDTFLQTTDKTVYDADSSVRNAGLTTNRFTTTYYKDSKWQLESRDVSCMFHMVYDQGRDDLVLWDLRPTQPSPQPGNILDHANGVFQKIISGDIDAVLDSLHPSMRDMEIWPNVSVFDYMNIMNKYELNVYDIEPAYIYRENSYLQYSQYGREVFIKEGYTWVQIKFRWDDGSTRNIPGELIFIYGDGELYVISWR